MNNAPINSIPLNTGKFLFAAAPGNIIFNEQELCDITNGVAALSFNKYDLPNFELNSYKSPLIDNGGVISHLIADRDIEFDIYIKGDDAEDFGNKVLAFKKKISRREGTLSFTVGSVDLITTASVISFNRTESEASDRGDFSLKFKSLENFHEENNTYQIYNNIIADFQGGVTNEGHRQTDLSMYLSFTTATALNTVTVLVNGYPITINETIINNDIIFIDSVNGNVEINGTQVEYFGLIPSIETNPDTNGFNPVEFQFEGGSTVDVTITIFYKKQYL